MGGQIWRYGEGQSVMGDTPATPKVQIFTPDGQLADIPYEQLHEALADGGKIAAKMLAPDGKTVTFVPGDRVQDAMKDGAKRVPLDMNDADGGKPGFWSNFKQGISGLAPQGVSPYPGMDLEAKQ